VKKIISSILFFLLVTSLSYSLPGTKVFLLEIDGTINPVVADYISKGLSQAASKNALAVIIKMDTPGGLMDSMRQIIKAIEAADFPVIVYVGDAGARAASAGAFITMASDIAVMAKGTNIGAAHPVKMGEQETPKEMEKKMAEDARAFIKSLAKKHNRNAEWAQKAVTESVSITSTEAVELNVVEYEVKDFNDMKSTLEGKTISKNGKDFKLSFKDEIEVVEMAAFKKLLNYISHPNFAYILLIIGVYGLIYEFSNPGIGLGAVVGGMSLLLAALAFQMIPINVVGILLIIFGVILMFTDLFVPSFGILTIGGLISFLIGSLTLFDVERFPVNVSLGLILGATITTALFFIFAAGSGIKIQKKKVTTGIEGMIGIEGEVKKKIAPKGEVLVRGEFWEAESPEGEIEEGVKIEVVDVKGNLLIVKRKA
jgi:membrane-bound serine protease (ClpP class)